MTVAELIGLLEQVPQDAEVICEFLTVEGTCGYPI